MSMTIDNKTFRNLEEQVLKNKEDIAKHYEVDRVLADWGIKVIGVVATVNNIPEGNYQYGDSYGLSSTSPMQYVIWTRANPNVGQDTDYWLNVGALSLVGPQGAQGIQGIQGVQGVRGSKWTSSTSAPTATSGYNMGDQWLNTTTGDVYEFRGNTWARLGNIKGPQGVQGPIGPKGDQGIQGPTGSQGPKGDTGSSFTIAGLLNNAENLPTPTEANRHKGYAVKNADNVTYDLYVVVGEAGSLQWVNMGRVEGVEGPQGPVGPQGPAGADIQIVHITGIPSTATQGNLTQDQVNTLLAHPGNYIQFFNENFYPQDVEIGEGYIVYSHVGQIGSETKIKNINLTIATGSWVLTETSLVSAPISVVNELPEANEENFEKGKIYTTGETLQYLAKVQLTEPNISQIASLPFNTKYSAAVKVGNVIYVVYEKLIYKYDINTNSYTLLPIELQSSKSGGALAYYNNCLYAVCGSIEKINITTNTVETLIPTIGTTYSAFCVVDNKVYAFGGYNSQTSAVFNMETETVSTLADIDTIRAGSVAVNGHNGYIYIFGGWNGAYDVVSGVLKWSISNSNYTKLSISMAANANFRIPFYTSDKIYLIGGTTSKDNYTYTQNKISVFDISQETSTQINQTLEVSFGAYAQDVDKVYMFGGAVKNSSATSQARTFGFGYTFQYKTIATQ